MLALYLRDIRLSVSTGGGALTGVLFFLAVIVAVPFSVGPDAPAWTRPAVPGPRPDTPDLGRNRQCRPPTGTGTAVEAGEEEVKRVRLGYCPEAGRCCRPAGTSRSSGPAGTV